MKKYWNLFWQLRKVHLMRLLEFRANFFFWSFVSTMWSLFNIFFFTLVISATSNIGGWSPAQMYVLQALFTILDAIIWSFFYHNMNTYATSVFDGSLSEYLVKPIDPQYMLMVRDNSYSNVFRFIFGCGMLWWAINQLPTSPTLLQLFLSLVFFIIALFFIYSLWFTLTTLSFWVERLSNINEVIPSVRRIFQVPSEIFTGITSFIFTVALPLSLIATLPSQLLFGTASIIRLGYFAGYTVALMFFSRWFFKLSIKKYSGMAN